MSSYSCVYMVKEREFTKTNEEVIKVGYSNQEDFKRFKKYPKGSLLLFHVYTENGKLCETEIIKEFKKLFIQRKDIGNEYFEGDYNVMRRIIIDIVEQVESNLSNKFQTGINDEKEIKSHIDILKDEIKKLSCFLEDSYKSFEIMERMRDGLILEVKKKDKIIATNEYQQYKYIKEQYEKYKYIEKHEQTIRQFINKNYILTENRNDMIKLDIIHAEYITYVNLNIILSAKYPTLEDIDVITINNEDYYLDRNTKGVYNMLNGDDIGVFLGYYDSTNNKIISNETTDDELNEYLFGFILDSCFGIIHEKINDEDCLFGIKSKTDIKYRRRKYE